MCSAAVKPGQVLAEVAVLASQPLTALRDAIQCEADANLASQHQSRPAGFFYIEVSPVRLAHTQQCQAWVPWGFVSAQPTASSVTHGLNMFRLI